jgi:uroporphyrinogen III methyltransferase/synthase
VKSKKIVVTRASHQALELASLLEARGAIPVFYPCIEIVPPEDTRSLDDAIRRAAEGGFDRIVFTSANTVFALSSRFTQLGIAPEKMAKTQVAAIGPATADAVRSMFSLSAETVPEEYTSESLARALACVRGCRIFLPQSDLARSSLRDELSRAGAVIVSPVAYRTAMGSGGADVPCLLENHEIDAVTFTSSSTVDNFVKRLAAEGGDLDLLRGVCVACLGEKTALAAAGHGIGVTETTRENTLEGLVAVLARRLTG